MIDVAWGGLMSTARTDLSVEPKLVTRVNWGDMLRLDATNYCTCVSIRSVDPNISNEICWEVMWILDRIQGYRQALYFFLDVAGLFSSVPRHVILFT